MYGVAEIYRRLPDDEILRLCGDMQVRFAGMERIATLRTGAGSAHGTMASHGGTRVSHRGGSGPASDAD